jgi:hypothetical protein
MLETNALIPEPDEEYKDIFSVDGPALGIDDAINLMGDSQLR